MKMLRYFYENDLLNISEKTPKNWEEAIAFSGEILQAKKLITVKYIEDIIGDVHTYGPYIVIVPNVAMPHSSAQSEGVLGTGIGLTIFSNTVSFEEGNAEKDARLFFTLAAKDADTHMENIAALSEMLMVDGLIDDMLEVRTMADYEALLSKYENKEEG